MFPHLNVHILPSLKPVNVLPLPSMAKETLQMWLNWISGDGGLSWTMGMGQKKETLQWNQSLQWCTLKMEGKAKSQRMLEPGKNKEIILSWNLQKECSPAAIVILDSDLQNYKTINLCSFKPLSLLQQQQETIYIVAKVNDYMNEGASKWMNGESSRWTAERPRFKSHLAE